VDLCASAGGTLSPFFPERLGREVMPIRPLSAAVSRFSSRYSIFFPYISSQLDRGRVTSVELRSNSLVTPPECSPFAPASLPACNFFRRHAPPRFFSRTLPLLSCVNWKNASSPADSLFSVSSFYEHSLFRSSKVSFFETYFLSSPGLSIKNLLLHLLFFNSVERCLLSRRVVPL